FCHRPDNPATDPGEETLSMPPPVSERSGSGLPQVTASAECHPGKLNDFLPGCNQPQRFRSRLTELPVSPLPGHWHPSAITLRHEVHETAGRPICGQSSPDLCHHWFQAT